jgi:hypothetical protein
MNTQQQAATNLLTEHEVAPLLRVSPATLRSWRCRGIGPNYIKMGRGTKSPVRYNRVDLEQFVAQCRHVPLVRAALGE